MKYEELPENVTPEFYRENVVEAIVELVLWDKRPEDLTDEEWDSIATYLWEKAYSNEITD
jgi:hypothetical protein